MENLAIYSVHMRVFDLMDAFYQLNFWRNALVVVLKNIFFAQTPKFCKISTRSVHI